MDKDTIVKDAGDNELMKFLGVRIVEVTDEKVVLEMEVTPKVHQYVGIMHGGVSLYLSKTAASIGAVANADLGKVTPVGVEINGNHVRAVGKGTLTVTSVPVFTGRTMAVWQTEIRNDKDKLVCTSRCSFLLQRKPAFQSDFPEKGKTNN
ncbi:MAG TPA: hotdog fold thioesterase [Pyrinomonadaceae bacterium]|nr:hotdog fold thioesterase [Pyrinomonadaceae bacterium]